MPLSLDTELPTTFGWTLVRNLNENSVLIDELGYPTKVVGLSPSYMAEGMEIWAGWGKKKEPEDDGRILVGDIQRFNAIPHQKFEKLGEKRLEDLPRDWTKWSKERTAREIAGKVRHERKHGKYSLWFLDNHIPISFGVQLPARRFSVDPWILGVCINYYRHKRLKLTVGTLSWYREQFAARGHELEVVDDINSATRKTKRIECRLDAALMHHLDQLHFANQIPRDYLRGSEQDRMALLEGLMDRWDEFAYPVRDRLTVSYGAKRQPVLAQQVAELVRSLGFPAYVKRWEVNGHKPDRHWWFVCWHPPQVPYTHPKLRLRYAHLAQRRGNNLERYVWKIYSAEPYGQIPVRDIVVDGMYSVGRLWLPVKGDS